MDYGDNDERLLFGRVSDEVIADHLEAERSHGQIRSFVAHVRKFRNVSDGREDFLAKISGSGCAVCGDELPNFGDVLRCGGMKHKSRSDVIAEAYFGE